MAIKAPLGDLDISLADNGIYQGFSNAVALTSKIIIALIVIWAVINPSGADKVLADIKNWSFNHLNYYYTWSVAFFILVCIVIAVVPSLGKTKLGTPDGVPEFSNLSWFSVMFGAGIGIGMLGYATGEPMWHMGDNPDIRLSALAIKDALASASIALPEGADVWAFYKTQVEAGSISAISGLAEPKTISSVDSVYRYSLVVNTISAGGDPASDGKMHIIVWGLILTAVISALLLAGGLDAIQAAMIIGAIPFSFMMILMGIALLNALIRDRIRAGS